VIGCRHGDHVAGQDIYLKKEIRNNPLYLPRFMRITSFFTDNVEFVKEEDTGQSSCESEELTKPLGGFA